MNYCQNCGAKLNPQAKFCPQCGTAITQPTSTSANKQKLSHHLKTESASVWNTATSMLNQYTGEAGPVKVNLKNLFSQVFQKHTQKEAEEIFIAGTATTTPDLSETSSEWGKPWLFSRILMFFGISFILLLYLASDLGNVNAIPGVILMGAFAVPFSALVFFFEMNAYRNISFYEILKVFFLGGILALLVTVLLYSFVTFSAEDQVYGIMTWTDTLSVGIVEEVGKLIIVVYFVSRKNYRYILNGILIGAAVGGGFAAFETAGYIYNAGNQLVSVALLRAATAIGGHVVWAAITGGALVMVKKDQKFQYHQLIEPSFLVFFGLAIAMHALWDKGISLLGSPLVTYLILIVVAWVIVFVLINAGLKQVAHVKG